MRVLLHRLNDLLAATPLRGEAALDERISQHPRELREHGLGGQPAPSALLQGLMERLLCAVVKNEEIQRDVGINDEARSHGCVSAGRLRRS